MIRTEGRKIAKKRKLKPEDVVRITQETRREMKREAQTRRPTVGRRTVLKACIDTNVWISGILFSGPPAVIVTAALHQKFEVIASQVILEEIERNLLVKFEFGKANTRRLMHRILQVAELYEPAGTVKIIPGKHPDNLILETAYDGRARYLVTGDREHLLPLKHFRMVRIIEPVNFLNLLTRP